jgi:hypothetical protein
MKAVILASLATLVNLAVVTAAFRSVRIERRALALVRLFFLCLAVLVGVHLATPDDLGVIPAALVARPGWFDLVNAVFFFGAAFFGGVLQLYNLAERGFSLRILIDVAERPGQTATVDEIQGGYSRGSGLGWMYEKRINGLVRQGLVAVENDDLVLTRRGMRMACVFAILRRFLKRDDD